MGRGLLGSNLANNLAASFSFRTRMQTVQTLGSTFPAPLSKDSSDRRFLFLLFKRRPHQCRVSLLTNGQKLFDGLLSPLFEVIFLANEKFGVIFKLHRHPPPTAPCASGELWQLPARAWHDTHACALASEIPGTPSFFAAPGPPGVAGVASGALLWEPVRRLCAPRALWGLGRDTLAKYAAYSASRAERRRVGIIRFRLF